MLFGVSGVDALGTARNEALCDASELRSDTGLNAETNEVPEFAAAQVDSSGAMTCGHIAFSASKPATERFSAGNPAAVAPKSQPEWLKVNTGAVWRPISRSSLSNTGSPHTACARVPYSQSRREDAEQPPRSEATNLGLELRHHRKNAPSDPLDHGG